MKITGVTIIKNAVKNDYPVVEAITSILPMVDEMIVSIDKGNDGTDELIKSIASDKIRIVYSTWDMALKQGGRVYAIETDKAITHVSADTDWIFYIQADEVIHEKYHPVITAAAEKYATNKKVQGLLFKYLHFYATYDYVGDSRKWYNYEIRMIKNDRRITSYKDAQGFRMGDKKLDVVLIDAEVYHYGWVKEPHKMLQKQKNTDQYYLKKADENHMAIKSSEVYDFEKNYDSLRKFTGSHPSVMLQRIKRKNWQIELDISKKKFSLKQKLLFWFEKKTGKRLFDFKNYRRVKG
ncbi:MAG: glycosyltransferase family 2 protein [Ferruginibacter sp.]|uniref:glycosyltransferase family 2 protein n=1 Tax=Ferruginibacter sp. TaxID=1940288 RepID=UPI002657C0C4|nr:glycosyltransferase family 2 protein [Ferruginibacter sp.]MDB5275223.1 glycosyltransferase family 2 protein [Ferruginibacter sp.]